MGEPSACYHCGAPATLLCDFAIGLETHETVPARRGLPAHDVTSPMNGSRVFTCDRPLCEACATDGGTIFACGEGGYVDSVDHCKGHSHGGDCDLHAPVITEAEADAIRVRLHRGAFRPT